MTNIVFFGTPHFVIPVLETLVSLPYRLAAVVTVPDKPQGRKQGLVPPPVKEWAQNHTIIAFQPEKLDGIFVATLQKLNPTIGIIAAYGCIIPKSVLDVFPKGVLNIHPSMLPRWRGPSPVQTAIAAGDTTTGVSIMLTDEYMDHGPVLIQQETALNGTETGSELTEKLFRSGAELLKQTLPRWLDGKIVPREQDHAQMTSTKILKRENGRLDFSKSAEELRRLVRAYTPWPGTFFELPKIGRIKVLTAWLKKEKPDKPPGTFIKTDDGFAIVCKEEMLFPSVIQQEGRKPISANVFAKGHPDLFIE